MDKKAQWSLVAAAWVLAVGVIAMGVYAIRLFDQPKPAPQAPAGQAQNFGDASHAVSPVDHSEIVVGPDTPRVTLNGTTYYFSDAKDARGRTQKERFLMDPMLYLTGASAYPAKAAPAGGIAAAEAAPAPQAPAAATPGAAPRPSPLATLAPSAAPTPSPLPTATPAFVPY